MDNTLVNVICQQVLKALNGTSIAETGSHDNFSNMAGVLPPYRVSYTSIAHAHILQEQCLILTEFLDGITIRQNV